MTQKKRWAAASIGPRIGLLLATAALVSLSIWSVPATASEITAGGQGSPGQGMLDLPYKDLLIGWLLAAAIGAVGGVVYVGIVGPARRDHRDEEED